MHDACSDPSVNKIVFMTSSQVGKTTIMENIHGYYMHQAPCPMLNVQANGAMLDEFSKNRIGGMCRDSPVLSKIFQSKISSQSTIHRRMYPGGSLSFASSNSPAGLASRPVKIVTFDEVDRYEVTKEGDAVQIGMKRTTTFWDSKIIMASTPGLEETSVVEREFKQSDMRYFLIPCPHCGHLQRMVWKGVKWYESDPSTAHYECEACLHQIDDLTRYKSIKQGEWKATQPFKGTAGFHLSELYSPWRTLEQVTTAFYEAKGNVETMMVWTNTALGETWKQAGERVDPGALIARNEEYSVTDYKLPSDKIVVITVGVDVQKDYLQYEVVGWGDGDESWSLEVGELEGDTTQQETFELLDDVINQRWVHPTGRTVSVMRTFIDSGYNTTHVYDYVKSKKSNAIKPIKGRPGKYPVIENRVKKLQRRTKAKVDVEMIGVDTAKVTLQAALRIQGHGRSFCHFGSHNDEEFFEQLTCEELRTKYVKGYAVQEWFKTRERNEATDTRVYAYAAMKYKDINFESLYEVINKEDEPDTPVNRAKKPKRRMARVRMRS